MAAEFTISTSCLLILLVTVFTASTNATLSGKREPCSNEGEEVAVETISNMKCFQCICQNGFVECLPQVCPSVKDCYYVEKRKGDECCDKCNDCIYKDQRYMSGSEWTDPDDPCTNYKCIGGVTTESITKCYTPCNNALPARPGQCCPTCLGCYLNGINVHDGQEVTLSEDPCLKCQCSNKRLTCQKKACPLLQCPLTYQYTPPGECCPQCSYQLAMQNFRNSCIVGKILHSSGTKFFPDSCTYCKCSNGMSACRRETCPVLDCAKKFQKRRSPTACCPVCEGIAMLSSVCMYEGVEYKSNETWTLTPCRSCRCHNGEIRCAEKRCDQIKCKPNELLVTKPGQCCASCEESAGVCTVFGDPHYKTFDGKFFSFQGACKYILASDCKHNSFSVRVANDARATKHSSWAKTIVFKVGPTKINLGQKLRVKVNGTKIDLKSPYQSNVGTIDIRHGDVGVVVTTGIGITILWDGNTFLQIQAPASFKTNLCGLCGNFNGVSRDDLMSRRNRTEENVLNFARSWRVGGRRACTRVQEVPEKEPECRFRKTKLGHICKPLQVGEIFGNCDQRLNAHNYYNSCKKDMCDCPSGRCYCDSFFAYAHECQRLGVNLPDWRNMTMCSADGPSANMHPHHQVWVPEHTQRPHRRGKHHRRFNARKSNPSVLSSAGGRTPPPLMD